MSMITLLRDRRRLVGGGLILLSIGLVLSYWGASLLTHRRVDAGAPVEIDVAAFVSNSCTACHGASLEGDSAPPLTPEHLSGEDGAYLEVIRNGRVGTAMPAWGGGSGLTDEAIRAILSYLREDGPRQATVVVGHTKNGEFGVFADERLQAAPTERGAAASVEWTVENRGKTPVVVTRFRSATRSLFYVGALPVRIDPGSKTVLHLALITGQDAALDASALGVAEVEVERINGGRATARSLVVETTVAPPTELEFTKVPVNGMPVRLAVWGLFLYVGYFDGRIDVFRVEGPTLVLVERVRVIAETPNHGADGESQPEVPGRLIGGMTVGDDGTLYVAHTDPRLDEGDLVHTGNLADLNSGTITELSGGPGRYSLAENRRDLVLGLPRNVTNHVPSGMDIGPDGWLYVAVGAMTDSGVPDSSKPDPDTDISGAILRINASAPTGGFPITLTNPGRKFATLGSLVPGAVELWATGVRNGFGLTFDSHGRLWVTDQGNDGGSTPQPSPSGVPPAIRSNLGVDHLHLVRAGDYLGQPNTARGEVVLNDGSEYQPPVASARYSAPSHVFGLHNSATGVVEYQAGRFPGLRGWLLVGKFSGALGLQALRLESDRVTDVRVLTGPPETRNVTDVVVGPQGEIIIAEFWERRLRIAGGQPEKTGTDVR